MLSTAWHKDPFSFGSYTTTTVNSTLADIAELAVPLADGRLGFAGESTCSRMNGMVHGALLSGLREANRLLKKSGIDTMKKRGPDQWPGNLLDPNLITLCEKSVE